MTGDLLTPGAAIGILGGGQLGRMLALAAARLGLRCHVFDPAPNAPAGHVAVRQVTAGYDDAAALAEFAEGVDVLTYEFENVPAAALDLLGGKRPIRPNRHALAVSQDRLDEKNFLNAIGLKTAPYSAVDGASELEAALEQIGYPSILKSRRHRPSDTLFPRADAF